MRFLGGLLKFLAVVILLVATVGCTAVAVMEGVVNGYEEAIWVMVLVWVCVLFVTLNILGTGIALTQLSKLKKRVQQLEQNPRPVSAGRFSAPKAAESVPAGRFSAPASEGRFSAPETAEPAPAEEEFPEVPVQSAAQDSFYPVPERKKSKVWIPVVIVAVVAVAVVAVALMSSGGSETPEMQVPDTMAPIYEETVPEEIVEAPAESDAIQTGLGGSVEHPGFVMTFDSVELLDEYSYDTSEYSSTSLYVEEGYKLLMLKGHFTNLSMGTISDSSFHRTAVVNGTYVVDGYDVRMNFLRSKSYEIDAYTDLDYVIYINIPDKLAEMYETVTFNIGFNDDLSIPVTEWHMDGTQTTPTDYVYAVSSNGSAAEGSGAVMETMAPQEPVNTISIGETIYTKDYEFTLRNVELTYEVLPPNTSSVYTSYAAESGKVYVHIEADVKNTMQRDIRIDELFESSALYDGKYPYEGFTVVNDGDNRFDWVGNYVAATPLETCTAHGLIECPVEVDTSGKSVVVTLELGDTTYEYILR